MKTWKEIVLEGTKILNKELKSNLFYIYITTHGRGEINQNKSQKQKMINVFENELKKEQLKQKKIWCNI